MPAAYTRNIQGRPVRLTLIEISPDKVKLDPSNPRIGFSMRQLDSDERSDAACNLMLTSQEDTEALRRSIDRSGGVQEPIYLRHDYTVAEGNRRVVALRAAKEDAPDAPQYQSMPAWVIPKGTPEDVIQDLLNEIHLGSVRGWAPYEKALQMRGLVKAGLIEDEVAERYRLTANDVKQQIAAVDYMDERFFPITKDPSDPEHRTKFSYFLEYLKNGRIRAHDKENDDLRDRFARWVRDGRINTGARVRRLPKILDSDEATRLLEVVGFDAAEDYVAKADPREQELYLIIEKARTRLTDVSVSELVELSTSPDRIAILSALQAELEKVLKAARSTKVKRESTPTEAPSSARPRKPKSGARGQLKRSSKNAAKAK